MTLVLFEVLALFWRVEAPKIEVKRVPGKHTITQQDLVAKIISQFFSSPIGLYDSLHETYMLYNIFYVYLIQWIYIMDMCYLHEFHPPAFTC